MKYIQILLIAFVACFSLSACDTGDSKAEKLGEKVDEAIEDTADDIQDACEKATNKDC